MATLGDILQVPRFPSATQLIMSYPLELGSGGLGVALGNGGLITATASTAQTIAVTPGGTLTVCNDGEYCLWFRIGGSGVVATLGCTPVLPGQKEVFTVPNDGTNYTHISCITRGNTTTGTANFGFGA